MRQRSDSLTLSLDILRVASGGGGSAGQDGTTRVVTTWTELIFGPNPRFVDSASSIVAMRMAAPSIVAMRMAAQRQRKLGQGSAAGGPSSA